MCNGMHTPDLLPPPPTHTHQALYLLSRKPALQVPLRGPCVAAVAIYGFLMVDAGVFYFSGAAVSPFEAEAVLCAAACCFALAVTFAVAELLM